MNTRFLKILSTGIAMLMLSSTVVTATAADAICYNCPPQWADWEYSGQTLSQLLAEKDNPIADVAYYGVSFGIAAQNEGVVEPYKPANWDDIPEGLKDPDGNWFTIHSGALGLFVNVEAGYLDPSSAFVGYAGAVAINRALGGTLDDFGPAIEYFQKLAENDPIVPKQTSYARVLSGEIPILFDYDFNAYRGKYKDEANVEFVIPAEGTVVVPYVMSLVKGSPNPDKGKEILDFIMSDTGQAVWANAFLRPVRASAMSEEAQSKFLPASEYERATPVDYGRMAEVQKDFGERYLDEVR